MQNFKVRIYTMTPGIKKNKFIVVAVMWEDNEYGTWSRVFKHRGISPGYLLEREMTIGEMIRVKRAWRLMYYRYTDWYGLIEDEWAITKNLDWCKKLQEISGLNINLESIVKFKIIGSTKY